MSDQFEDINPKLRVNRREYRTRTLKIATMYRKLTTVLDRDINKLMVISYSDKLSPQDAKTLLDYTKFLHELKAMDELEKQEIAAKAKVVPSGGVG